MARSPVGLPEETPPRQAFEIFPGTNKEIKGCTKNNLGQKCWKGPK